MQSDETLHRLGALDREMIEHRIRTLFERRAEGDLPGIMDYAADDIVYHTRGLWTLYPFSQPVRGKALVGQMLAMIEVMYENLGSTIYELVIDGDRAALHRTSRMRNRGTGALLSVDVCDFVRFRDGMVIEFSDIPIPRPSRVCRRTHDAAAHWPGKISMRTRPLAGRLKPCLGASTPERALRRAGVLRRSGRGASSLAAGGAGVNLWSPTAGP